MKEGWFSKAKAEYWHEKKEDEMIYRQINRCPTLLSSSPGGIIFLCDTSYISLLCCHGLPRHLPVQEKEIILLFAFVSAIRTILLPSLCHSKRAVMHLPVSERQLPPERTFHPTDHVLLSALPLWFSHPVTLFLVPAQVPSPQSCF